MMQTFSEAMPVGDLLVRSAERYPERVAVAFPDIELSFGDLLESAALTAKGLYAVGIRPGDHVGVLMPNCPEFFDAYFGAALLGCVLVPLNARYRSSELAYIIDNARLSAVLSTDRIAARTDFRDILKRAFPHLELSTPQEPLDLPGAERLRQIVMLDGDTAPGFLGRNDFYARAPEVDDDVIDHARAMVRIRDIAMILYTSGTTANPKGCLISHEAIVRGSLGRMRENVPLLERNTFWCPGPLFHIAGMQVMLASIGLGATFVTDVFFDGSQALEQIERHRVTSLWPWFQAVLNGLTGAPGFRSEALASVTSFSLIGPPAFLRGVQRLMPTAVHINGSGMTETAGYFLINPLTDTPEQRATLGGVVVAGMEVKIIDPETGSEMPTGEIGEILIRGYSVMEGYYRDDEKTTASFDSEGWLHTGDLFVQDETRHVTFQGRLKDMLKVGGENVPAIEVEAFLCTHPAVRLAEVVGRPDDRLDEVPVAFVEIAEGVSVTEEELIDYCRGRIASFKVPRAVYFKKSDEWPMSATKVNKVALRLEITREKPPTVPLPVKSLL